MLEDTVNADIKIYFPEWTFKHWPLSTYCIKGHFIIHREHYVWTLFRENGDRRLQKYSLCTVYIRWYISLPQGFKILIIILITLLRGFIGVQTGAKFPTFRKTCCTLSFFIHREPGSLATLLPIHQSTRRNFPHDNRLSYSSPWETSS
jgi:hypothetical protein